MRDAAPAPLARRRGQSQEIVGLDLLRFAAALMVMAFHFGFWVWAAPQTRTNRMLGLDAPVPEFGGIAASGFVGVEIFFVISGFVIAWSARQASFAGFARSRFLRLAPAAWICSSVSALALLASGSASPRSLLIPYAKTLTFFPTAPWIDDAYWTLDVEIAFYAIVALLIACARRSWIMPVIGAIGAISATFWLGHAFSGHAGARLAVWMAAASRSRYADLVLLHHGCFFCIGGLFSRVMENRRLPRAELWLGAVCVLAGAIEISDSAASKIEVTGLSQSFAAPIVIWLAALAAMAASIWGNAAIASLRLFAHSRSLGLATYPLYLLHTVVGGLTIKTLTGLGVPLAAALLAGAAVAMGLALLVSGWLEPALRAPLRRALSGSAAPARVRLVLRRLGGDRA